MLDGFLFMDGTRTLNLTGATNPNADTRRIRGEHNRSDASYPSLTLPEPPFG